MSIEENQRAEIDKLRAEVSQKQKRETAAVVRAERAEQHIASLRLENENLRALVVHLGCPNCRVGEIALTIHGMLFDDKNHAHKTGRGGEVFILNKDDVR